MVNLPMMKGYNIYHLLKLRIRNFVPRRLRVIQFRIPCHSLTCLLLKKLFLFCYPHTLTIRLKRPVYRGFSGEGKCEGKLSPLTLTLTPSWISLAIIRPVSLRLQDEGQKNSRIAQMHTESLTRIF